MVRWLLPLLVSLIALSGAPVAAALEIGERIGPVIMNSGGVICDTSEQAQQAIDMIDRGARSLPLGCGALRGQPTAFVEAIEIHETNIAIYMIVKIMFLPPARLGVQYGWVSHAKANGTTAMGGGLT